MRLKKMQQQKFFNPRGPPSRGCSFDSLPPFASPYAPHRYGHPGKMRSASINCADINMAGDFTDMDAAMHYGGEFPGMGCGPTDHVVADMLGPMYPHRSRSCSTADSINGYGPAAGLGRECEGLLYEETIHEEQEGQMDDTEPTADATWVAELARMLGLAQQEQQQEGCNEGGKAQQEEYGEAPKDGEQPVPEEDVSAEPEAEAEVVPSQLQEEQKDDGDSTPTAAATKTAENGDGAFAGVCGSSDTMEPERERSGELEGCETPSKKDRPTTTITLSDVTPSTAIDASPDTHNERQTRKTQLDSHTRKRCAVPVRIGGCGFCFSLQRGSISATTPSALRIRRASRSRPPPPPSSPSPHPGPPHPPPTPNPPPRRRLT